ncbi:MAG: FecR family protein [Pikeienuella sp.]
MFRTTVSILALSAALFASTASAEIGVLAAVNRDIDGARPSEPARPLLIKDKIVENERITSSDIGGGQILFLDQTSLTISPNSDIVLDKYVYDPNNQSGELGITVLKGALRMVGGRITKTKPALIKTPSATIGIRGGMGNTTVNPDGSTTYTHVAGIESTIQTDEQELSITRPGGHARIGADGGIEYLGIAPPNVVKGAYGGGSSGDGDGGSEKSDQQAEAEQGVKQVEEQVSGNEETKTGATLSTTGRRAPPSAPPRPPAPNANTNEKAGEQLLASNVDQAVEDEESNNAPNNDDSLNGGDIVDEVNQVFDSITFDGTINITVNTFDSISNGGPNSITTTENFTMIYSLQSDEGALGFSLDANSLGDDANEFKPDNIAELDPVIVGFLNNLGIDENNPGEGALVSGIQAVDGGVTFQPDTLTETFAGGEVSSINLISDADNKLTGDFVFDYTQDETFTDVTQISGVADIAGQGLENGANDIQIARDAIEEELLRPDEEFSEGIGDPNVNQTISSDPPPGSIEQ